VLGNHDYECGCPEKVSEILGNAGMTVLDEQAHEIDGVGFAGVKGFMGGYGRGELAPFGEPIAKAFVDEVMKEARKLENALRTLRTERSVAWCPPVDLTTCRHERAPPLSRAEVSRATSAGGESGASRRGPNGARHAPS